MAILESSRIEGLDEIASAVEVTLTQEDRDELESALPKPTATARMETARQKVKHKH